MVDRYVEYVPLGKVKMARRNPKGHDVEGIDSSISHHGLGEIPMRDDRTGRLVAGHGRIEALTQARAAGREPPVHVQVAEDGDWLVPILAGWSSKSDADAEAYLVGSNEWTIKGGWNTEDLIDMLTDLQAKQLLGVTGYTEDELAALLDARDEEPAARSDGSLLSIADVAIREPAHVVATGEVWQVGKHVLIVTDVIRDWQIWAAYLEEDTDLFVPYPGPYVPHSIKAEEYRLIMVQPDIYLAGHLLDKYAAVHGPHAVTRMGPS